MCRYALKTYKPHYVCFDCRKTFKQPVFEDIMQKSEWHSYKQVYYNPDDEKAKQFRTDNPSLIKYFEEQYVNKKYLCPDCRKEMYSIGLDFKAPKKEKIKQWEIVKSMYKVGNTFHTCGCDGPGYIPHNVKDYLVYLEKMRFEYQENLNKRAEDDLVSRELVDYLDYWGDKLDKVSEEIKRYKLMVR